MITESSPSPSRIIGAALDIETTGLVQTEGHRIIEVAIALHDLAAPGMPRIATYEQRVNPERAIDPEAEAVHHISFDDLARCPTWAEVAPKVGAILARSHVAIAHNGEGFDMPFIYGELARMGVALPQLGLIDTMLQGRWATPDGALPSLRALCWASGVEYDPERAHAALYDVEVMMACVQRHMPRGFFQMPTAAYQFVPMVGKKGKK